MKSARSTVLLTRRNKTVIGGKSVVDCCTTVVVIQGRVSPRGISVPATMIAPFRSDLRRVLKIIKSEGGVSRQESCGSKNIHQAAQNSRGSLGALSNSDLVDLYTVVSALLARNQKSGCRLDPHSRRANMAGISYQFPM